jgi:5-methylcytosine-specific restriction endonuclease McrA
MPLRPCLDYPCPNLSTTTRCPAHERERERLRGTPAQRGYGPAYQRARRQLLASATRCHWCGLPARVNDPLTADHLVPLAHGGGIEGNLVAAHRSCNGARGGGTRRIGEWVV